ncbi:Protein yippee-like 5 [Acropora cervicornis]|uniref:Protein yippee-like 5 n=1 Tax=Acropora cervicornis TaxID=6130 RepID=A0AAD9Q217_ACRCE|nr:Protein yippee-like 5 [Acropora cervicornis]
MGRIFLDHPGGSRLYSCAQCDTALTNRSLLTSMRFNGATGRAFLFKKVVNLSYSEVQDREMLTGRHMVRDVFCKNCDTKLGWMYEYATEESQQYKEGQVILERALVTESEGIRELLNSDTVKGISMFGTAVLKSFLIYLYVYVCFYYLLPFIKENLSSVNKQYMKATMSQSIFY